MVENQNDSLQLSTNLKIAHVREETVQTIKDHCQGVAALAASFAPAQLSPLAYQCGLYHDVGKYSDAFQKLIRGIIHTRVDHSTAGAQLLAGLQTNEAILEAFCIAGHHAGLLDGGTRVSLPNSGTFYDRLKKQVPDYSPYVNDLGFPNRVLPLSLPDNKIALTLYFRMLFSCLVDADFLDTERFMSPEPVHRSGYEPLETLYTRFFKGLQEKGYFSPQNELNQKRTEILQESIARAQNPPGIFTMTVPTGGGKTVSSFAFAMEHAHRHHKSRIIYVIPYTSIIEQTADVLQSFLGKENVLEHHSQLEYDDTSETMTRHRMATENWDAPVIVTTNVQFFESLFANRTSRCRKLHNIANSVIILDEAQMLPVPYMRVVIQMLEALKNCFHCSLLLCSATQPRLTRFFTTNPPTEIMSHIPEMYRFFQRTTFIDDGEKNYEEIAAALDAREQALCICLTKAEAMEVYGKVQKTCLYLSTELCPAHRRAVIAEMKQCLLSHKPCRVVSTSIISVGVDIDFPEIFLQETGLDALIQGAGRCNREGKSSRENSKVHIFRTAKSAQTRFLQKERQCTELTAHLYPNDMAGPDAIGHYFDSLYTANAEGMNFKNILELSIQLSFATIGRSFKMIEDNTKTVFIPYNDEAKEIEQKLRMGIRTRALLRKAGQYCISVWSNGSRVQPGLFQQLLNDGLAEPLDTELAILKDPSLYDSTTGFHYKKEEGRGLFV